MTWDGTETVKLLLERLTENPPLGAAAFKDTEQFSVPAPVIEPEVQFRLLRTVVVISWIAYFLETPATEAVRVAV